MARECNSDIDYQLNKNTCIFSEDLVFRTCLIIEITADIDTVSPTRLILHTFSIADLYCYTIIRWVWILIYKNNHFHEVKTKLWSYSIKLCRLSEQWDNKWVCKHNSIESGFIVLKFKSVAELTWNSSFSTDKNLKFRGTIKIVAWTKNIRRPSCTNNPDYWRNLHIAIDFILINS